MVILARDKALFVFSHAINIFKSAGIAKFANITHTHAFRLVMEMKSQRTFMLCLWLWSTKVTKSGHFIEMMNLCGLFLNCRIFPGLENDFLIFKISMIFSMMLGTLAFRFLHSFRKQHPGLFLLYTMNKPLRLTSLHWPATKLSQYLHHVDSSNCC